MKKNKSYGPAKRVAALFISCLMFICVFTACSQTIANPTPEQMEQGEVIARYNDIELSSTPDTATLVSDGSKIVLDGGSEATAIIYQFKGLAVKTTPTGTGAVNITIESSPTKNTVYELKVKAVYGFETSKEKTYYLMVEGVERVNKLLTATYNNVELSQDSNEE